MTDTPIKDWSARPVDFPKTHPYTARLMDQMEAEIYRLQSLIAAPLPAQIYFAVTVSQQRADFLGRMLNVDLCSDCGREADECDADPCTMKRYSLGEIANCNGCYKPFDPHHLNEAMYCPDCKEPDSW